jgi:hypothetical protein
MHGRLQVPQMIDIPAQMVETVLRPEVMPRLCRLSYHVEMIEYVCPSGLTPLLSRVVCLPQY